MKKKLTQEELNTQFDAMTPAQKRISIAKDVLADLDAEEKFRKLNIVTGIYCKPNYTDLVDKEIDYDSVLDVQSVLKSVTTCSVLKYDRFNSALNYNYEYEDSDMFNALEDCFDKEQLNLIENAFEQSEVNEWYCDDNDDLYYEERLIATCMYHDVDAPEARLRLIMKNLIDNDGEFVIPDRLEGDALEFAIEHDWINREDDDED